MAKYSRFDSRNKKRGKHKTESISQEKDFKIKSPKKNRLKMNAKIYNEKIQTLEA
jgi:hypothetical protein